jgi:hypothetical protein
MDAGIFQAQKADNDKMLTLMMLTAAVVMRTFDLDPFFIMQSLALQDLSRYYTAAPHVKSLTFFIVSVMAHIIKLRLSSWSIDGSSWSIESVLMDVCIPTLTVALHSVLAFRIWLIRAEYD